MKNLLLFALSLLLAVVVSFLPSSLLAQTEDGASCETAIHVTSDFSAVVPNPGTYWFSAWTYDLPLNVTFTPAVEGMAAPQAELDFTCTPGVYEDSVMRSLFDPNNSAYIYMPKQLDFTPMVIDGQQAYVMSVGESHRQLLGMAGLTSEVQAFVKVTVASAGSVNMVPDSLFRNCVTNTRNVALGDSLMLLPNDSDQVYMLPYSEWKNDSVQYVWRGRHPLRIWLARASTCSFSLSLGDINVWDYIDLQPDESYKMRPAEIAQYIANSGGEGFFYARMETTGAGYLVIEQIPEKGADDGTIALRYNQPTSVAANSSSIYYITRADWQNASMFASSASASLRMVVSASSVIPSEDDPNVVGVFSFAEETSGRAAYLSSLEMSRLWDATSDKYLYVRFFSTAATTVTPSLWAASDCDDRSTLIVPGRTYNIAARSSNTIYRLRYADFAGDTLVIAWQGSVKCPMYVGDTCVFTLSATNSHVAHYKSMNANSKNEYEPTYLATWPAKRQPNADGYYYVRFNPTSAGTVTFTSSKVQEPEPCLDPLYVTADTTVCDTLLPISWRGHLFTAAATWRDTLRSVNDCDSVIYSLTLTTTHCTRPTPVDPTPITPVVVAGANVAVSCPDERIMITVTDEQNLVLYDALGHVLESWHQAPGEVHYYTPVCGVQYVLKGKNNTFKIVK